MMATTPEPVDLWRASATEHERLEFKEAKTQSDYPFRRRHRYSAVGTLAVLLGNASCAQTPKPPAPAHVREPAPTSAPVAPPSAFVPVACGLVFAGNEGRVPFAALLRASRVERVPQNPNIVVLDGVLLEVQITTAAAIGAPHARGLSLLMAHQKWLSAYISRKMTWPALHVRTTPANFELAGVDAMAWDFAVPEPWELLGKKVVHVGYATVAIDDAVFALSVPLRPGDNATIPLQKVSEIVGSVQRLKLPFDPRRDDIVCR
jgi:hypothetical protein